MMNWNGVNQRKATLYKGLRRRNGVGALPLLMPLGVSTAVGGATQAAQTAQSGGNWSDILGSAASALPIVGSAVSKYVTTEQQRDMMREKMKQDLLSNREQRKLMLLEAQLASQRAKENAAARAHTTTILGYGLAAGALALGTIVLIKRRKKGRK